MTQDLVYSNDKVKITFKKDKILHIHYLTNDLTLQNSKDVLAFTRLHSPWKICPVLLSGGDFINQSKEGRDYNSSYEVIQYCSAIGFLSDSLSKRLVANFFVSMNKDKIPMRFFPNEQDAFEWLSQFETITNEGVVISK